MTLTQYTLENSPITVRPECPKCATQMFLERIELEKPGFETRIFECPRCQHNEFNVVQF
jgi:ribosomal protein S27AE